MAASFRRLISIDFTKCGTVNSTNFPVLVKVSDATLADTGHGGHVQNSSGFDITFWANPDQSSVLTWDMDTYDNVNGVVWAWVSLPTLFVTKNTNIYMFYGDSTISTFQSTASTVWSNANYVGVWHFGNGTTLSLADSTINANNGTNVNAVTATTGQIAGGASFVAASSQYISLTDSAALQPAVVTLSLWANTTAFGTTKIMFRKGSFGYLFQGNSSNQGSFRCFDSAGAQIVGLLTNSIAGAWHYFVGQFDATNGVVNALKFQLDQTASAVAAATATGGIKYTANQINIGSDISAPTTTMNGLLDEIRVASVTRSTSWITAEFNNQNSPSTFIAVGAEFATAGTNATVFESEDGGDIKAGGPRVSLYNTFLGGF